MLQHESSMPTLSLTDGRSFIHIEGFHGLQADKRFCVMAEGTRYHEYGIVFGSVLLCKRAEPIRTATSLWSMRMESDRLPLSEVLMSSRNRTDRTLAICN